ncbi:hypothetical protein OSTOST_22783, partial [Ostertagia ostertagi]
MFAVSYNLTLKTYLPSYPDVPENKNLTLEGEVEIMVEVHKAINQIVLHMERLELIEEKCEVLLEPQGDSSERIIPIRGIELNNHIEVGVIRLTEVINANSKLKIK